MFVFDLDELSYKHSTAPRFHNLEIRTTIVRRCLWFHEDNYFCICQKWDVSCRRNSCQSPFRLTSSTTKKLLQLPTDRVRHPRNSDSDWTMPPAAALLDPHPCITSPFAIASRFAPRLHFLFTIVSPTLLLQHLLSSLPILQLRVLGHLSAPSLSLFISAAGGTLSSKGTIRHCSDVRCTDGYIRRAYRLEPQLVRTRTRGHITAYSTLPT